MDQTETVITTDVCTELIRLNRRKIYAQIRKEHTEVRITREVAQAPVDEVVATKELNEAKNEIKEVVPVQEINRSLEALFLGPRGENSDLLISMVTEAIQSHKFGRNMFQADDPFHTSEVMKENKQYLEQLDTVKKNFQIMLQKLAKWSVPWYNFRYQGHMLCESTLPSMAAYFAGILYNPNNVAFEGSMYTSVLEFDVMKLMTTMVRYPLFEDDSIKEEEKNPDKLESWGHLTCDGTVANIEAFWAARNSKFLAYAIQQALLQSPKLKKGQRVKVVIATGEEVLLVKLDPWTIINIPVDNVLSLPHKIWTLVNAVAKNRNKEEEKADPNQSEAKVTLDEVYSEISNYTVARKGLVAYYLAFFQRGIKPPKYFVPGSKHYSLPKAGSMLGIGEEDVVDIAIDADARLLVDDLVKKLEDCLKNKIPVLAVVCVMGSTEESATDPLVTVLEVREKFRKQGLDFHIHADAAYGGYFSCLMGEDEQDGLPVPRSYSGQPKFDPISAFPDLNDHTRKQFQSIRKADSITVDPHKVGFVPYAVGSILYKNSLIKKTLNFSAPVLNPNVGPSMSTFGLEGSKAGATAAAVYLTHTCLPLDKDGHGRLLGYCLYNTKVYYAKLLSLPRMNNGVEEKYRITSVCRTPVEKGWKPISPDYRGTKEQIVDLLARRSNEEISRDLDEKPAFRGMVNESGPDQNIISYSINFKDASGNWNTSLQRMNRFNDILYQKYLSPQAQAVPDVNEWEIKDIRDYKLMLSHTEFARANYGQVYYDSFVKRSEVNDDITDVTQKKIVAMRSVLLSPWAAEASFFDTILDELVRACDATMKELSAEEKKRKFLAKKA